MKLISQKTSINKLLKRYPRYPKELRYELLAKDLGITPRWVRILGNGKPPSNHLRKLIKILLDQPKK